jgi:tetratricopeptide (TPR) repeat protein/transglutaminase-like putative cysteine protease
MCGKPLPIALLLASITVSLVFAQEKPADKPLGNPASKSTYATQDFSKEAYVIEHSTTRLYDDADGTGTRELTAEVKILADAGVKTFAVLNFTYTSANETVEIDYVRVRKPDGTIVKTPDYNIQDMPGEVTRIAPLYSDLHERHVAVKGLSVGDVLEYLIRIRVVKPEVQGQFWHEYTFVKNAIAKDESLELNVPANKYVKVVSPDFKPEIKEESGRRTYRWTHTNLVVEEKNPDEIPRRTPPNPDVQVTTFASWQDVGRWYGELQKDPSKVTPAIQTKADELTKGLKTDDEKIHAIYNFVSLKYHYVGLDFGIGRYQPHAADEVLDNGYGDCKDKHTLLAALLKAAGIEAWPALIHSQRKLDVDVPSPAQFNHVITVVPSGAQFLWLDTTPEVAPYGLLLQPLRNKQALVIPPDGAPKLMTTPGNPLHPQWQEFSMEGKLSGDGTFTGHAEITYEGADSEVVFRSAFRQLPESQWKDLVQRMSSTMNFGGEVSNVKVTPPDEIDQPFEISYDYVRKGYAGWENHHTNAPLPPMGIEAVKGIREKEPEEPVLLGALGKISYRSRVELPEGYRVTAPSPVHLVESYADYDSDTNIADGVMTTTRTLRIKQPQIDLSEWRGYRSFGEAIYDDEYNLMNVERTSTASPAEKNANKDTPEKTSATGDRGSTAKLDLDELDSLFRDGSAALQRRDFQRAQELMEKIIANDPEYKGAHFNLGVALAQRKSISDALDQFQLEEKISPEDPRAYQAAAMILASTGQSDAAMDQWRKLLKVDPTNRKVASTLGNMLYAAEKYPEAVEVLEKAVKIAPDSRSLQLQLGEAYLKVSQNEKGLATIRQAVDMKADNPMLLNNVAYTLADDKVGLDLARQYGEKAVSRLEEDAQGAQTNEDAGVDMTYAFSMAWDTLGWVYFQQGQFKSAESLVRASWLLNEDEDVGEHLGEIYEKEGKTELALHAYENALTVSGPSVQGVFSLQSGSLNASLRTANEIKARYRKLAGKEPPLAEIHRLPNGEWTQTPAERLRHSREIRLSNEGKLTGSAEFIVALKPGKVDSAVYKSGDEALAPLSNKLKAAHFPLEFPTDSRAILSVRVSVKCQATSCIATLATSVPAPRVPPSRTESQPFE